MSKKNERPECCSENLNEGLSLLRLSRISAYFLKQENSKLIAPTVAGNFP